MTHALTRGSLMLFAALLASPLCAGQQTSWPTLAEVEEPARRGDPRAQVWLGVLLVTGEGQRTKDVRTGLEWIRKSADAGHPLAQRLLGDILSSGKLAPKDDVAALAWYQRAAQAGDPDAQSELGMRHTLGWGVSRDDGEGVRWALKAAAGGDVAAMMYLASRYEKGRGVAQEPRTAVELFRQASDRGSALAMCYLADMYLWGQGVDRDPAAAYQWYSAAFAATPAPRPIRPVDFIMLRGDARRNCERGRKEAAKALTSEARMAAQQRAGDWLATVKYTRIP